MQESAFDLSSAVFKKEKEKKVPGQVRMIAGHEAKKCICTNSVTFVSPYVLKTFLGLEKNLLMHFFDIADVIDVGPLS